MSEQQRQWVLEICGDDNDLNVAADLWVDPDHIKISKFDDQGFFGITSSQFSTLSDARQVLEVGIRLLGLVNGALFIRDTSRKPLTPARVYEQTPNGVWNRNIIVGAGHYEIRGSAPDLRLDVSGEPPKTPPYPAWTAAADSNDCVAEMLRYLSREPDWFDLYSAFEKMRDYLNRQYGQHQETRAGWPKLDDFTESANVYRHSSAKWKRYTPETAPMTLKDAQSFVRNLAEIWLRHCFPT